MSREYGAPVPGLSLGDPADCGLPLQGSPRSDGPGFSGDRAPPPFSAIRTRETADAAKPLNPDGELYQQRAFAALPILVRQARSGRPITYGDLADELEMPNPRNLNYVLGSLGNALAELSEEWDKPIPKLQSLVVNRSDRLPGQGFMQAFVDPRQLAGADKAAKRHIVRAMWAETSVFSEWDKVLEHFGAPTAGSAAPPDLVQRAASYRGSGEESEAHRALKSFVAENPSAIGLRGRFDAAVEHRLPSGDSVDVLLTSRNRRIAVEVKSHLSPIEDVVRGIFQCVKYQAVLEAQLRSTRQQGEAESILVLGRPLDPLLRPLVRSLAIPVADEIQPQVE